MPQNRRTDKRQQTAQAKQSQMTEEMKLAAAKGESCIGFAHKQQLALNNTRQENRRV
jgi:hypothetical protein